MGCPDEAQLIRLASGELSPHGAQAVERHVGECPRCAAELETLRAMWNTLGAWAEDETAADLWPAMAARLEVETRRRGGWLPRTTPAILRAAASVAIAIGLGWVTGAWLAKSERPSRAGFAEASIEDLMEPLGLDEFVTDSATGLQTAFDESGDNGQEGVS